MPSEVTLAVGRYEDERWRVAKLMHLNQLSECRRIEHRKRTLERIDCVKLRAIPADGDLPSRIGWVKGANPRTGGSIQSPDASSEAATGQVAAFWHKANVQARPVRCHGDMVIASCRVRGRE